jgi:hypothetical protein
MKKFILFAIILSISAVFMTGCSKGDEGGADNSVNKESTLQPDFNKPAAVDNPGASKPAAPL